MKEILPSPLTEVILEKKSDSQIYTEYLSITYNTYTIAIILRIYSNCNF